MINAEQTGSNMLYISNARHLMVIIMRNIEFAKSKWNIYDMCVILVVYIKTSATINNDHDVFIKRTNVPCLLVSSSVTVILPILAWELPFLLYSRKYRKNDCLKLNVVLIRRNTFVYNWIQYRWIKVIVYNSIAWKVHFFEVPPPPPGKIWTINTILSFLEDIQTDLELPNYDANAFTSQLNI